MEQKTSIFAIASLTTGIIGIIIHLLFSYIRGSHLVGFAFNAIALGLGIYANIGIKKNPQLKGKGMAIAGIILGILPFAAVLVMMVLLGAFLSNMNLFM